VGLYLRYCFDDTCLEPEIKKEKEKFEMHKLINTAYELNAFFVSKTSLISIFIKNDIKNLPS
jgi:hypothetical protein